MRVLARLRTYLGLVVLDPVGRHELRVRQRCGVWRYRELMESALVMPRARQWMFQWGLRRCARRARATDLAELLDAGWRERLVASWLIAVGRRAELRPRLAQDLRETRPRGSLDSYCVALACLGTEKDAQILRDYLIMSLALPEEDERHCQPDAMGALVYLDHCLGTRLAAPIIAADGLWQRWPGSAGPSLEELQRQMASLVAFARGADPGLRVKHKARFRSV